MEREFTVGVHSFKLNKIDAFKQFHIVRRIGPLISEIIPAVSEIAKIMKDGVQFSEEQKLEQTIKLIQPLMNGLSKLSDDDSNKVLLGLLSAIDIKQQPAGNWSRVADASQIMFQNLELPILLNIAGRSLFYNLGDFFSALPQASHGGN